MKKIVTNFDDLASSDIRDFAVTHNGTFHCDDVFSAVILDELMNGNLILIRVSYIPKDIPQNLLVFDIGGGAFDHHYIGSPIRPSGIKYSSVGLIWKEFGRKLLKKKGIPMKNINSIWHKIDKEFIQAIDASDNGALRPMYPNFTIAKEIANFNPVWDTEEESNKCFEKAFEVAKLTFNNIIENELAKVRAKDFIEKAISNAKDGIMILPRYLPWYDFLKESKNSKSKEIQYVIFKNNRNNFFNIQTTPYAKKLFPIEWAGVPKEELRTKTNIATINFCHPKRYLCETETEEDALKLIKIAMTLN